MTASIIETTITILGKPYQIKCPENEAASLQRAADFLEEQTRRMRQSQMLSSDKILVAAALNIAHQLLISENQALQQEQRLRDLQNKLDHALLVTAQMELPSA